MGDTLFDRWPAYEAVRALWRLGRLDESAALLSEAAVQFPDDPAVKLARASQILREDGRDKQPVRAAQVQELVADAIDGDEPNADALLDAALLLIDIGDFKGAARHAIALEPVYDDLGLESQGVLFYVLGRIAAVHGEKDLAVELLTLATQHDPSKSRYGRDLAAIRAGRTPHKEFTGSARRRVRITKEL